MKSARIYDFTLSAGGSFTLNVEGDYVRVMSTTGAVEIVTDSMRLGPLMAGQGQADSPYKRITINDKSGSGNIGSILVASSGFVDQRISGEVSTIDGEKARTLAGGSFSGTPSAAAVAAQFAFVQLWNPAGSGKNLIVPQISIAPSGTGAVSTYLYFRQIALATDQTANYASNKKAGQPMGTGLIKSANSAVAETFPLGAIFSAVVNVSGFVPVPLRGPLVVPPGFGLNVISNQGNSQLQANFEWFEESI